MKILGKILHKLAYKAEGLEDINWYEVVFEEGGKSYTYHKTEKEMTETLNKKWYDDDSLPFSVFLQDGTAPQWKLERPPAAKGFQCKRCEGTWKKKKDECPSCGTYMIRAIR